MKKPNFQVEYITKDELMKSKIIIIEFDTEVSPETYKSITLTNINNTDTKYTLFPQTKEKTLIKLIKFEVKDEFEYGTYSGILTLINESTKEIGNNLLVYDKPLELATSELYYIEGTSLLGSIIKTNNEIEITRIKLKLQIDNETQDITYDIIDKNLKINKDIETKEGIWTIIIEDPATTPNKEVQLIVYSKPVITLSHKENTKEPYIVIDSSSSIFEKISFTLSDNFEHPELFFLIKASNININFERVDSKLQIKDNKIPDDFKTQKDKIDFYFDENNKSKITTSNSILFIDCKDIPTFKNENNEIKFISQSNQISLPFNKLISNYTDYVIITADEKQSNIQSITIEKDNLIVKFENKLTENFKIKINFFDKIYEINAIVIKCEDYNVFDEINNICTSCDKLNSSKPFAYKNEKGIYECTDKCPDKLFHQNNTCIERCINGYGIIEENKECVNCAKTDKPNAEDGVCQKGCSEGLVMNEFKQCVIPESISSSTMTDKCDNYCKRGNCTLENGSPICTCEDGYYGLTCNIEKGNITAHINNNTLFISDNVNSSSNINTNLDLSKDKDVIEIKQLSIISVKLDIQTFETVLDETKQNIIIETTSKLILYYLFYRK